MFLDIFKGLLCFVAIVLISLEFSGCGGGGSDEPLHCQSEGYPLYCSAVNLCCPPDANYICDQYTPTGTHLGYVCNKNPCDIFGIPTDYCGEE